MEKTKEPIINQELVENLISQIKLSIYDSLEEEAFKYPYVLGFSECLKLLKEKYQIELDIDLICEKINDKMIREIISNL